MTLGSFSISDIVKNYAADVLMSFLGPLILSLPIHWLVPSTSATGVISMEWILSMVLAGALGFFAYRTWRTRTARFTWVIFVLWFVFGLLVKLRFAIDNASIGSLWIQFSGIECTGSLLNLDCQTFPLLTIPLVRGLSYSAGAFLAARVDASAFAQGNADRA